MRVVASGRQRTTIIAKMEIVFRTGKCVNIEAKGVEIIGYSIWRLEINGRQKASFSADFQ